MTRVDDVEIRPARPADLRRASGLRPSADSPADCAVRVRSAAWSHHRNQTVAVRRSEVLGACVFTTSPGRCALVAAPQMHEWHPDVAARLIRATTARAHAAGARLIQIVTRPDPAPELEEAIHAAGLAPLATLVYMRRAVEPGERDLPLPGDFQWKRYTRLRRRLFIDAIERTYEGSLDCPGLKGLRTVRETFATHRATGQFRPEAWHVAMRAGEPVGVELVNNLHGRGELVYLGVAAAARGEQLGRVLLDRAIRDTDEMGLPKMGLAVDTRNTPAMRLYEEAGFRPIRRRLVWFVPRERLEELE